MSTAVVRTPGLVEIHVRIRTCLAQAVAVHSMPPASSHIPPSPRAYLSSSFSEKLLPLPHHKNNTHQQQPCSTVTSLPTLSHQNRSHFVTPPIHSQSLLPHCSPSSSPATTPRLTPHQHTKLVGLGIQQYIILFLLLLLPSGASGSLLILVISPSIHYIVATLIYSTTRLYRYTTYFCSLSQPRPEPP